MASVNPNDRDRGLRLIGAVTTTVAALSLVAIGATTALAADETRQADAQKAVSTKVTLQLGPPSTSTPTSTGPTAAPVKPTKSAKKKAKAKVKVKATHTASSSPSRTTKPSPKPKTPSAKATTPPPAVSSTGS
jgi:hypothetical protein